MEVIENIGESFVNVGELYIASQEHPTFESVPLLLRCVC
jgi:hypothetical protein